MKKEATYLNVSAVLAVLIAISAVAGVISPGIYEQESFSRQVYFVWHDYVHILLLLPLLLSSGYLARRSNKAAQMIWGGVLLYIARNYGVMAFTLTNNKYFLFHCIILAISVYFLAWLVYSKIKPVHTTTLPVSNESLLTAVFLIGFASTYYLIAFRNLLPSQLDGSDSRPPFAFDVLFAPATVFDMSLVMPLFVVTGVLLILKKSIGRLLTAAMLTYALILLIAVAGLDVILYASKMRPDARVAMIAASIAVITLFMLHLTTFQNPKVRSHPKRQRMNRADNSKSLTQEQL